MDEKKSAKGEIYSPADVELGEDEAAAGENKAEEVLKDLPGDIWNGECVPDSMMFTRFFKGHDFRVTLKANDMYLFNMVLIHGMK
jgi:hypothetical protein